MIRSTLVLCAIAFVAVAASPANAAYKVVRFPIGICQVWNDAIPNPPIGGTVVSRSYKAAAGADRARARLVRKKRCM